MREYYVKSIILESEFKFDCHVCNVLLSQHSFLSFEVFLLSFFCCTITCIGRHTCQRKIGCSARFTFLNSCLLYLIVLTSFNVSKKKRKYFFYENKNNALTGFGLESRRKVFKSPPAKSSSTMKRGCLSKQTPMK